MPRARLLRPALTLLAAAALAGGCGGDAAEERADATAKRNYQRFASQPDLEAPKVVVRQRARRLAPGYLFITPKKEGLPGGPMIIDDAGRVVWFHPVHPRQSADFRVQRYRGRRVLTWWEGTQPVIGIGSGKFVVYDDSYRPLFEVEAGNGLDGDLHEFLITRRNTALICAYVKARADLSRLRGPKDGWVWDNVVQELELPSGRVLWEWRSLEHVPPVESALRAPARTATEEKPLDYFHINSIDVDKDGNLLLSARNTHAIYKIGRRSGRIFWRLGGRRSDFRLLPGVRFAWQHDARRRPDGTISLFDNSAIPKVAEFSRALVIRLNERAKVASLVRAYKHPDRLLAPHQGNAQTLPTGGMLVGWGGQPYVTEFGEGGGVVFDARLAVGDSYRAYRFPWRAEPAEQPAAAARESDDGRVVVYASWNGATDVAAWEVLAGSDEDDLRPVDTARRTGFETRIAVRTHEPFVAVRALDAGGTVLGTSPAVEPQSD